jgi:hypothetical protein
MKRTVMTIPSPLDPTKLEPMLTDPRPELFDVGFRAESRFENTKRETRLRHIRRDVFCAIPDPWHDYFHARLFRRYRRLARPSETHTMHGWPMRC